MPKGTDLQYERETTITFNEAEDNASVWSASPSFQRKMEKLGIVPVKTAERERGNVSAWYEIPRHWVRIRKPQARIYTEEQRAEMGARLHGRFSPPENNN